MSTIRFKVLQAFPVWRKKVELKPGDIVEIEWKDTWKEVGFGFYFLDSPRDSVPDFSDKRLLYLLKHKYIGNPE